MAGDSTAVRLGRLLERMLRTPVPLRVRAWDGSEAGPADAPVLWVRDRRALRRLAWQPNELGLARAYVAGEIEVEGDLYDALRHLAELLWFGTDKRGGAKRRTDTHDIDTHDTESRTVSLLAVARDLLRLGGLGPQPKPPVEEITMRGRKHSLRRDGQAISHHYDVGNEFYRIVLGGSMVYSCAYWTSDEPGYGLADAQRDKLELICRKLDLRPGARLLDVGCGWGGLALHAAREHGVSVLGVTLSNEQAERARKRLAEADSAGGDIAGGDIADRVEIRLQDYRELDEAPFDAIASIGMAEHVGVDRYRDYAAILHRHLRPGGRLLNHQIAALHPVPENRKQPRTFIDAYVFPDGELAPLGTTVSILEEAGFEVRDVEALREHYARTLRAWVANLEADWDTAAGLATPARARVWRLYMAASALAFAEARLGVNQILAVKAHPDGRSDMPPTRRWLAPDS
ncbi:class I SAM-dependent methyltransferase [Planosporangium mesophilum]|uniref:Cyclopropane-fatty-acyl-phospholipid synthase n=1 Tax=Planosporangium mesophilum TaxID=689768 RepID=A0A8J3TKE5_9ACTN|nr:class I SAM-dependent methyltransferase [Planosporangium mesophilum]NJC86552.1 methyltransferase domain-containing protein [Planosporangium mesophilum]GII26219.1 cyclopropane-fatty-acyl-phospholipid synthase [Planosporangium mesophilum]